MEGFLGTSGESRSGVERAVRELLRRYGEEDADEVAELTDFLRPRVETQEGAGADLRERRFAVFVRVLRRMAHERPVLLVLDDIDAGGADAAAFVAFVLFELGFEPCAVCGKTMLVAPWLPGGRRGQSKYCSNACNQKMKRMKAKARLMLAEGAGRRRVAKELGVTETWLRERKL